MSRQVAVVTGTRAEYGLLKSPMAAVRDHESLSLSVLVTGMHLSPQHGSTYTEIEADGFEIDHTVHMLLEGDSGIAMAKSLGIGVSGFAEIFEQESYDVVLVLGDRDEAFAAAVAAAHMNIPVAHIHGGDAMQGAVIDDSIRHALTKFAHIHFPVSEKSTERLLKMGEEEWRITTVGAPGLDDIRDGNYDAVDDFESQLGFSPDDPLVLLVQHPLTTAPDEASEQMAATLDALDPLDVQVLLVYPNADAGGKRMIEVIEDREFSDNIVVVENLPRNEYLAAMERADVMVGNSSSGIIESPSFGLPVVDIGPRQKGRERAENVYSVPHDTDAIQEAVERCLTDEETQRCAAECANPYDFGGAGSRIAKTLAEVTLDDSLLRKRLRYEY